MAKIAMVNGARGGKFSSRRPFVSCKYMHLEASLDECASDRSAKHARCADHEDASISPVWFNAGRSGVFACGDIVRLTIHGVRVSSQCCRRVPEEQLGRNSGWVRSDREEMGHSETGQPIVVAPAMKALFARAMRLAPSNSSVLITGETGTGKEVMARQIHSSGPLAGKQFVVVNCASVPANLLESTLFGHERGAFTGAVRRNIGAFESASGGTLFLDEIGELPLAAQASLLRVLETKRIIRVGATQEIPINVRIISATHRDLPAMVAEGSFREDFLYRINVVRLHNPPLRERCEEILPIAVEMLRSLAPACAPPPQLEPAAAKAMLRYCWPGNLRELRNAMEHASVFATDGRIGQDALPVEVQRATSSERSVHSLPQSGTFRAQVANYEAGLLLEALEACDWNRVTAAHRLGLPLRTLTWKLHRYGLAEQNGAGRTVHAT
jgi:DNA-binding NtrC family response regulator